MFDQDPHLFNCQNGVIDLRTGELQPHNRKHWMMKISPASYNPMLNAPSGSPTSTRYNGAMPR